MEANPPANPATLNEILEVEGRITNALPLVEQSLREAGIEREQIDCLAIGIGPGSYAGIRSAIALAQGWQLAREIKLLAISSVECIAEQARLLGLRGRTHIVIDAQRNEFYLATYEVAEARVQNLSPLALATRAEVRACSVGSESIVGPEVKRWFPLGRIVFPCAGALGRLAAGRSDFVCGEKIVPIYLRETSFVKAPPPRVIPETGSVP